MSFCLTDLCSFSTIRNATARWFAFRPQRQKNSEGEAKERRVGGAQRLERRRGRERPQARVLGNKLWAIEIHKGNAKHAPSFPWKLRSWVRVTTFLKY